MQSVDQLELGIDANSHASLAAEVSTVSSYLARPDIRRDNPPGSREQAFRALDAYILRHVAPPVQSGAELYAALHSSGCLQTGCPRLDQLLDGGLRTGQMTELVGESGSGKTQVCLLCCLAAAIDGNLTVHVDTSNAFSPHRLKDMLQRSPWWPETQGNELAADAMLNIEVRQAFDVHSLLAVLDQLSSELAAAQAGNWQMPRLLVIDAFSALISPVLGSRQSTQGHTLMIAASRMIKVMAIRFNLAAVVVNHTVGGAQDQRPALGEQWRSQPNVRVHLARGQGSQRSATLRAHTSISTGGSCWLDLQNLTQPVGV